MIQSLSILAEKCMSLFGRNKVAASVTTTPEVVVTANDKRRNNYIEGARKRLETMKKNGTTTRVGKASYLTPVQRNEVRTKRATGKFTLKALSEEYDIPQTAVHRVCRQPMEIIKTEERSAKVESAPAVEAVESSLMSAEPGADENVEVAFMPCSSYLGTLPKGSMTFSATHLSREAKSICDKRGIRRRWVAYSHDSVMGAYSYPIDVLNEAYLGLMAETLFKQGKSDAEVMAQLKSASR